MKITIFGSGYVGLVTGVCFAEVGNDVICVDIDSAKIEQLKAGKSPIYEPGLDSLLDKNLKSGRLTFTTDIKRAVQHGAFQFIAVGTPSDEDGSADLQYVLSVAKSMGQYMTKYCIIIDKSTVPVGTADKVKLKVQAQLDARKSTQDFAVVSNPEFLKEGDAISDFMKPNRIVIGSDSEAVLTKMRNLYAPFNRNHDRLIGMCILSAELTKYAANAMLATKISFMNEIANIADKVGADIEDVRIGIGSDPRIGYQFIYPGVGYGGSCFPKDVRALEGTAKQFGYNAEILTAVEAVNARQKVRLYEKIKFHFNDIKNKTFAIWGLSFKPNTDDIREAPSKVLIDTLLSDGAKVQAYDPEAMQEMAKHYGNEITFCNNKEETLHNADALVVITEWQEFRSPDFEEVKKALNTPVIFDGRNIFNAQLLKEMGIDYYAIGRGITTNR